MNTLTKTIILFLILTFQTSFIQAQLKFVSVNGKVLSTDGNALESCLISISKKDSSVIKSVISDSQGAFKFNSLSRGTYLLSIQKIGYKKVERSFEITSSDLIIEPITLELKITALKDVAVFAKKPLYEQHLDKTIINVKSSILAEGNTVAELLESAPGVSYSDGKLSLKGKSGVNVWIDGKAANLTAADLAAKLQSMSGKLIDKIEIIENPSSKYDAEGTGGIINIITKKNNNAGFNGSLTSGISAGVYNKYSNVLVVNYRIGNFNFFGDYSYQHNKSLSKNHLQRLDLNKDLSAVGRRINVSDNQAYTFGADFQLNPKSTLGVLLKGFNEFREGSSFTNTSLISYPGTLDSSSILTRNDSRNWKNFSANLNYRLNFFHNSELFIDVDRSLFSGSLDGTIHTDFSYSSLKSREPYISTNYMPRDLTINSLKGDYTYPFSKSVVFDAGFKYSFVETANDARFNIYTNGEWIVDKGKTNNFVYKESIKAGYLNFKRNFNKIEGQTGLRGEYTNSDGNSVTIQKQVKLAYFKLFPTAFLSADINKNQKINVAYSKRIGRPNYNQLNPFTYFVDNYNYFYGNPYIKPSYTNSISLNHSYKESFLTSLNYTDTRDYISYAYYMEKQPDSTNIWIETFDNLNSYKSYSLSVSSPVKIGKIWYSNSSLVLFYNDSKIKYKEVDSRNTQIAWRLNTSHSFSLPYAWKMEISGSYQSKMVNGFWTVFNRSAVNAGVKRAFAKNKASISASITDIFNKTNIASSLVYNTIFVTDYTKNESQLFKLNLTYQFNSGLKASRQRTTGSEDEQKRTGF